MVNTKFQIFNPCQVTDERIVYCSPNNGLQIERHAIVLYM